MDLGILDTKIGQAIVQAADEIIDGTLAGEFPRRLADWIRHTNQHERE